MTVTFFSNLLRFMKYLHFDLNIEYIKFIKQIYRAYMKDKCISRRYLLEIIYKELYFFAYTNITVERKTTEIIGSVYLFYFEEYLLLLLILIYF